MTVAVSPNPALEASTGSSTLDRVKAYSAVKKTTDYANTIVSQSNLLSSYVAPAAAKGIEVAGNVASVTSGYVPTLVKSPVKKVAGKVDTIGENALIKLEDVATSSQEKLAKTIVAKLPLDDDIEEDEPELSYTDVKTRVLVNTKKAAEKVLPETAIKVAGKSVSAAGSAARGVATAYSAMTMENVKGVYNACTVENAKNATKDGVKGAYNQCTYENAKKVVKGTGSAAKTVAGAGIATSKAVAGAGVATTKAVAGATQTIVATTAKVAGASIKTAVAAKNYVTGTSPQGEATD